jgi:hypothetical protein
MIRAVAGQAPFCLGDHPYPHPTSRRGHRERGSVGARRARPVVLDAGALIAFERNDRKVRTLIELAMAHRRTLHVAAGVVAQVWRDGARQARLARLLGSGLLDVQVLDRDEAQAVGVRSERSGRRGRRQCCAPGAATARGGRHERPGRSATRGPTREPGRLLAPAPRRLESTVASPWTRAPGRRRRGPPAFGKKMSGWRPPPLPFRACARCNSPSA